MGVAPKPNEIPEGNPHGFLPSGKLAFPWETVVGASVEQMQWPPLKMVKPTENSPEKYPTPMEILCREEEKMLNNKAMFQCFLEIPPVTVSSCSN
jgi:hypothetical protein